MKTKRSWRYWRNLGGFTATALVAGYFGFVYLGHSYFLARGFVHPQRLAVCCETPADRGLSYETATLVTSDGLTLRGWYIPSTNGAAVMALHQLASNRLGTLDAAEMLARHGYGVLMFDLRAHGESDGDKMVYGGNEAEDIRAAADYLRTRPDVDPNRIGALGLSLGAQVSVLGAAQTEYVRAVVADSPCCTTFGDWPPPNTAGEWLYAPYDLMFFQYLKWHTAIAHPVSVRQALAQLAPRPVLLLGGDSGQDALAHLYAAAQDPKQLWVIPNVVHTDGLSAVPDAYEATVIDFLDEALLNANVGVVEP